LYFVATKEEVSAHKSVFKNALVQLEAFEICSVQLGTSGILGNIGTLPTFLLIPV